MAVWLPNTGKVYLPPARPVPRVLSTDEYVQETGLYFYASSDRLLTVGHPYFPITDAQTKEVTIPKVSGNQYRVFRLTMPDPNKFALIDKDVYDPDKERLVWKIKGIEVLRGGPLGIGSTGHPLFNKLNDTENPNNYFQGSTDSRQNVSMDPKQTQMLIIGCEPVTGAYWDAALPCATTPHVKGDCPPLQLVNSYIEDGDMCDIGFGAFNFNALQADRSAVPLEITASICKWPDFAKMTNDIYGNQLFFFAKREQVYARHFFTRNGVVGDSIPELHEENPHLYFMPAKEQQAQRTVSPSVYFPTPSGSLVSSDALILNRPYWMQRAQGLNNGVCWNNQCFVTVVDNTHNTNFTISTYVGNTDPPTDYTNTDYKQFLRHCEEFDISIIVQLCKVSLEADILAHLNAMDSTILDNWNLAFIPPPATAIEDHYRYITSLATRCPDQTPSPEKEDPYGKYNFWTVDLTDKMTTDLSQTSLGRRFIYQVGILNRPLSVSGGSKRKRSTAVPSNAAKSTKRRRST
ncbi:L1 [Macaca mulatta papillomavirus 5]|uniref:L1 n=1 Tax=Macaca mulatta papillomavirus 5 TaxID=2364645 RepID=UPI000EB6E1D3|nr:L1 [Macaca mulatta papillomavirus 5]AYD74604.1 L1 [Macaca mulatta papillomavirus 5]